MQEPQTSASPISIANSFQFAGEAFLKHFWILLAIQLTMSLPQIVISALSPGTMYGTLGAIVLQSPMWGGYLSILVAVVDGNNPSYSDLFKKAGLFWKFLLITLCTFVVMFVGFILLIVPGIIACIHMAFCNVCVAEEGLGPIAAIKRSSQLTKGYRWQLLGIFAVQSIAFAFIGAVFIGIPLGVAGAVFHLELKRLIALVMPIMMLPILIFIGLVLVYCYRKLTIAKGDQAPSV